MSCLIELRSNFIVFNQRKSNRFATHLIAKNGTSHLATKLAEHRQSAILNNKPSPIIRQIIDTNPIPFRIPYSKETHTKPSAAQKKTKIRSQHKTPPVQQPLCVPVWFSGESQTQNSGSVSGIIYFVLSVMGPEGGVLFMLHYYQPLRNAWNIRTLPSTIFLFPPFHPEIECM